MSVQFYGHEFDAIGVFQCFEIMHCFQKLDSDLGTFLLLCVNKTPIQFALVCEHKELECLSWETFVEPAVNRKNSHL